MTMIKNSMISLEREGEGFERFLDHGGREFDDFLRMWRIAYQVSKDSSMTMIENWMISFEREGEDFERFLDDDGRQFDDFLRT